MKTTDKIIIGVTFLLFALANFALVDRVEKLEKSKAEFNWYVGWNQTNNLTQTIDSRFTNLTNEIMRQIEIATNGIVIGYKIERK